MEIEKQQIILQNLKKNNMKNKILTIISVLLLQSAFGQKYPLDYKDDVPDGAYYKDTNNELDKYVGLWKGSWMGKTLYLDLRKVKTCNPGTPSYYKDRIVGERKIISSSGTVEIDRISNFSNDDSEFWGMNTNLKNGTQKMLTFAPKNRCHKMADLIITGFNNSVDLNTGQLTPQMTLHLEYQPSIYNEDCIHNNDVLVNGDFPINFPKDITLIKQ